MERKRELTMRNGLILLLIAVAALAMAQFRVGSGMPREFMLLRPDVAKELKLTEAQRTSVREAAGDVATYENGRLRVRMQQGTDMASIARGMGKTLKPEQRERLSELWLQQQGEMALGDATVAKDLGLTEAQNRKVKETMDDYTSQFQELIQTSGGRVDAAEAAELKRKAIVRLRDVLSEEQRKKLKTMMGKSFTFDKA